MKTVKLTTEAQGHGGRFSPCLRVSVVFLLLVFLTNVLPAQTITQPLHTNWQFTESGKNEWLPATVPGTVHTDLMAAGKIPDPYIGTNEAKVQWVETKTWEYKTTFDCSKELWKQKNKELVFEGLDTYADVYLNGTLLFTSENMFVSHSEDVNASLKKTGNVLRIVFHPASELIEKNKQKSAVKNIPGGDRAFIRKAQYQFGWDWGPRLVTCGVWRPVMLKGNPDFYISEMEVALINLEDDTALVKFFLYPHGETTSPVTIKIKDQKNSYTPEVHFDRHLSFYEVLIKIPHPKLWWCSGMGEPYQYVFDVSFKTGKFSFTKKIAYGLRTITLDTAGNGFRFILNGEPVFIKGANWIPCDNFLPRVTTEKYYNLLKNAQQSNMNMLRVWGGGVYEDDRFYDICDSLGIMVWQDFMFAGGMLPVDRDFPKNIEREADYNLYRLGRHACISIWCGNNEITEGWHNWGWQKELKLSPADSISLIQAYKGVFERDLPITVALWKGPVFPYWPSSPSTGWGRKEAYTSGDVHYWGVWWGMEPFSAYETHVGRFVSEYGFQSMPPLSSFRLFAGENLSLNDSAVRSHQKHPEGFETISAYMERDYPKPQTFEDYIYLSQVMQRDGISTATGAHRRARPYCMGTLFWQYNDCWPVTSWSTVDYYGQPKLLQYTLKDLYAPLLVSITERNDSVLVYVVNDDTVSHSGVLGFQTLSLNGLPVRASLSRTSIPAGSSELVLGFSRKMFLDTLLPENAVMNVVFNYENGKSVTAKHYFVSPKDLALVNDPGLTIDVASAKNPDGTVTVSLRTVSVAKSVYLFTDDPTTSFSDNGFDLLPGQTAEVKVKTKLAPEELRKRLNIRTLNAL